jgi:hypothetical protein
MLTDEQVKKFQTLYTARFGKSLSRDEAVMKGERLVRLIKAVYKPTEYKK